MKMILPGVSCLFVRYFEIRSNLFPCSHFCINCFLSVGSRRSEKVYIPVKDYPDINFLGLLIGPKGVTQKQMQESTGAKILIRGRGASKDGGPSTTGHPDDNDELHVSIEGSDDAVEKALKEVRAILFNPEQAQRLKNEQLQRLAEFNNPGGSSESHYGPAGSDYQIELRVPNHLVGLIIGRGGENIVKIQTQLQVNCQIAKEHEMKPGDTLRSIVVKGPKDGVEEAKVRIDDIIFQHLNKNNPQASANNGNQQRELDHAFVVKLPVPNDKVGIIIGRGGMTIKGIQERTKSFVQIPPGPDENDPNVRTLSIGADSKEAVDAAQMEIFMTFQSQQQNAANAYNASASALQMLVPDDRVGIIIGKGGATVKDIQTRHRVRVQIPQVADIGTNPPMRTISIVGPPEGQQQAKYEIEMVVAGTPVHGGGGRMGGMMMGGAADPYASAYGAYGAGAASAYGSYYDPYAAAAAYSAYYGAATAGYPAATTPTAANAAAASAGAAGSGTTEASAAGSDATAYYAAYWQYAAYYGEAAARMYYGAWSPPEGTQPPEGTVLPSEEQIAANTAAATAAATSTTGAAETNPTTSIAPAAEAAYDPSTATAEGTATNGVTTASPAEAITDPTAAAAAWEAYQKQYKEWYEAHGKAAGADPNPPAMA
jgi:far upstream element-binding protein